MLLYFAMAFSVGVEMLNLRVRRVMARTVKPREAPAAGRESAG